MGATKIAVSLDDAVLRQLDRLVQNRSFSSRSQAVQAAVSVKIGRMMDNGALARECAKLDRATEQTLADEGLATDVASWPKY